jgi:hypothetical protein
VLLSQGITKKGNVKIAYDLKFLLASRPLTCIPLKNAIIARINKIISTMFINEKFKTRPLFWFEKTDNKKETAKIISKDSPIYKEKFPSFIEPMAEEDTTPIPKTRNNLTKTE